MNPIKTARKLIESDPQGDAARTLSQLVLALESEASFDFNSLYALNLEHFDLAIEILKQWRIDRYYVGKAKLFDLSHQVRNLAGEA